MLKSKAQSLAFKNIKITGSCQHCKGYKRLERHHTDYDKPLEVIILCSKCHKEWHKLNKAINGINGDFKTYLLRLPDSLYKQLEKKAEKTMYSINLLIVEAVKKSLEK